MNDANPSLELTEVSARFDEAEGMLQEARERLQAILLHERRREDAADSLTESARAVAEFTTRADQVLEEAARAVSAANEVAETGRRLFGGKAIDDVDQRVATALQEIQRLQTAEAETLEAVNANAKARELDQQEARQALAELQSRVGEVDQRVAARLDEVQRLQTTEAGTLAAVKEDSKSRAEAQESHDRLLAELQQRVTDIGNGVKSNRRAVWFTLAALLVGQVVVAVLAVLA